ncbi:uncharacterized protein [Physcomitrium patens]|uniref:Magnesium transporter n=1 Tax=Physcomitrium patens TaxID=3218 RepID=A0A2K1JTH6_PHYPA|nr:magnesium transporter MRS2 homolog, mitochondrial-like isoform X1 [Physcomitrium patens]XP_024388526.1 magnesium transporter MRS2 homolog, mitochondrial-like isoform X1 [Physcomitrium patens]XP_024388527.1 magnesium transporter MRS2 homolog, mitochondrial-like isoform X1 [Physcomitrium patens]XP_024388528.1 magnesium transporter MRS2 homolog, mitochondrial-like isoform X1 [Physcomitrium patens]XP_024388530.1 magnesium transporter MRS2 homolog, mitochondrial-like isoform X1 [Physcomitrium pat|eukprot:XP_024388525.1 magnesium transporter MRS2 homolog, mitochondrial-like isoform X1 [Physcomitrella patens]
MARVHLQRFASTYILSQQTGSRGFLNTSRILATLGSSSNMSCTVISANRFLALVRPISTSAQHSIFSYSHDENNRYWSHGHISRYCTRNNHSDDSEIVSLPDIKNTEGKNPPKKVLDGGAKFNVVRIDDDGSWHHLSLRTSEFNIHPRDIDLLARSKSFVPQRATISVRNEKVIVRMENVRALVCRDHAILFEARRPPIGKVGGTVGNLSSKRKATNEVMDRAREFFAISMAEQVKNPSGYTYEIMPFHLKMIECLLEETSNFFNQKVERLKVLVERILEELTSDVNMGGLQRLLPLKRALTEVEHDIHDAHNAMEQVLNSDENLQALCLEDKTLCSISSSTPNKTKEASFHHSILRQAAADMLLTYQREFDDAGGALEELRKDLNAAQEIWELGLDTTRNRIIRTDLMMSMCTLSVSLAAAIGAFFGMNLQSGFEEHPTLFWWVSGCATATSVCAATMLFAYSRVGPKMDDRRRAQDLAGLQNLVQHLDDLDDIFQVVITEVAGKPVTQLEFMEIVRKHPSAQHISQSELDLMFRLFDVNRNRVLELKEFNLQHSSNFSAFTQT